MPQPIPYLSFNGNCADAMRFYERVFEGDMKALMSYGETPMADEVPKEAHDRIMHAFLVLKGGGSLYAGDCPPNVEYDGKKQTMLAISYPTETEAVAVFHALADGGEITMPLAPTFWAKIFGMVTDKFGVSWAVNGAEISA